MGLKVGIVTNSYWATSVEDAELWLQPLSKLEVFDISLSDDAFHFSGAGESPARIAMIAARNLGMPVGTICIKEPGIIPNKDQGHEKGQSIIGGDVVFRGRAVEKLTLGLPKKRYHELTQCPYEDLENPKRVHLDSFGNVHLCQGLSMGNMWEIPLSTLVKSYDGSSHPISGPLIHGGPAVLAKKYRIKHEMEYVDECHFCYSIRSVLREQFPQYLAPGQVYGVED